MKHLLKSAMVLYFIAMVFYLFKNQKDVTWAYYHSTINLFSFLIIWFGLLKKNKSDIEKILLISIMILKCFNWLCYSAWYAFAFTEQNEPYVFCIVFASIMIFSLLLVKSRFIWK